MKRLEDILKGYDDYMVLLERDNGDDIAKSEREMYEFLIEQDERWKVAMLKLAKKLRARRLEKEGEVHDKA